MKDGRIENQGNLEEIREANPELAASWISAVSTSRPDSDSEMSATEERAELLRQISVHEKEEMMTTDSELDYYFSFSIILVFIHLRTLCRTQNTMSTDLH